MPMKTRYDESPWAHAFPASRRPNHPKLRGEHERDVVIIGGGLTGVATAYACAASGLKTIVLEAGRIGSGGSGRSEGLLLPEPGPSFRDLQRAYGLRAARTIFDSWRRASRDAAALLRRLSVASALEPSERLTVTRDEKLLRREFEAREAAGLGVRWMTARQVQATLHIDALAGMRSADTFALDPYRACVGLSVAARKHGATFAEQTAVRKVTFNKNGVVITGDGLSITARTVIVATGSATAEFKALQRHFTRRERYLVLTEPVPAAIRKQLLPHEVTLGDTLEPHHQIRWTGDNRLLLSGADQDETAARTRAAVLVQRTGQLMYELLMMYPAISGLRPEFG